MKQQKAGSEMGNREDLIVTVNEEMLNVGEVCVKCGTGNVDRGGNGEFDGEF